MKECELELSSRAVTHLFRYFGKKTFQKNYFLFKFFLCADRDDSGAISYNEFLVGVRGVLNKRRKDIVRLAFDTADKDHSGVITVEDLVQSYNAQSHPDVVSGLKGESDVLKEFLFNFETGSDKDAVVTIEEFEAYYSNISASIDNDDYFELMIRNAWHIGGGEGWCSNTSNKRIVLDP